VPPAIWLDTHLGAHHHRLDWFVVFGTTAFSVAEFAPLPAQR